MNYIYQEPLAFRKGVGVVLGSFSPLHKGHLDLIYQAKKECMGGALVVVCGYGNDKGWPKMTLKERYQMVRQYFRDDPLVAVYALSDDEMGIAEYATRQNEWQWGTWLSHLFSDVIATNDPSIKEDPAYEEFVAKQLTFYTGEQAYSDDLQALGYKTVLLNRQLNLISGTTIRDNPIRYWDEIAWTYHRKFSHNILITGTASEGKTTLVEDIGRYFNWDKIFMVLPRGQFVDDHTRYMKHSSIKAREELASILLDELDKAGLRDKVEIIDGGYQSNFNRVKNYIKEIGG